VLVREHRLPIVRACRVVRLSRTAYYQPPVPASRRDAAVIAALPDAVTRYPRWGFWKLFDRLRVEGRAWNHKRVHRVYCALRLNLPRRTTRRVPRRIRQPLTAAPVLNQTWALDFMTETLYDHRRIRLLTVIDEGNREALEIAMGVSLPSRRVVRVLNELVAVHGRPTAVRVDNGPESTAQPFVDWCAEHGVATHYIQPGKPDQTPTSNASIAAIARRSSTRISSNRSPSSGR
jgi:putative transposase